MLDDADLKLLQEQCADLKHNLESAIKLRDSILIDAYENEYKHLLKKAQRINVISTDVSALKKEFDEALSVGIILRPEDWERLKMLGRWTSRLHLIINMERIKHAVEC